MVGLSEEIIRKLTEITNEENTELPLWIDKKFIEACVVPPLSSENNVQCRIAVVAPVAAGKSTLFNSICGYPILPVASKTTSAVPTYITRTDERSKECVTVYKLNKVVTNDQGIITTRFEREEGTQRTYCANDISEEMFRDLFQYMYFVTHGIKHEDGTIEYKTTIENVAYFTKSTEISDILFNGNDPDKFTISEEDYKLLYSEPRHRLLLLLVLLCVYVDQNDAPSEMSKYTEALNRQRLELLRRYKFPADGDYCVCLDWCSDDIPQNTTLIDLPGTGSSTQNTVTQSSHTALVRGILTEADAIWVLCSATGTVDQDLFSILDGVLSGNSRKNKVCIYNCINKRPHDSGPVIDFLKKLPCLTGERCYVVDALAGEYKYTQNRVNALLTKTASDMRCINFEEPTEAGVIKRLSMRYNGEKCAYCTFTTSRDAVDSIIAVQDSSLRYTLDTFFKSALTDYIRRLRYEVTLTQAIEQAKFYIYIRDSLASSREILESIDGKGEVIAKAVNETLSNVSKQVLDNYVCQVTMHQTILTTELATLNEKVSGKINKEFCLSLNALITKIKSEWKTLEQEGHSNCLESNLFGNYPLRVSHPNWKKFTKVRDSANSMITISAFDSALKVADGEIKKYNNLLKNYTNDLKSVTGNFVNDYINTFLISFDKKRDELCNVEGNRITDEIYQSFNSTRARLKTALTSKLTALSVMICDSFDVLTENNGIFDSLCNETHQVFRESFCENILDGIRIFIYDKFTSINYIGMIRDHMKPAELHKILDDDFSVFKNECTENLSKLIYQIYGINTGGDKNFPSNLAVRLNKFNGEKITCGAKPEIKNAHNNISSLVGFGASIAVDLSRQIKELDAAISKWAKTGEEYKSIYDILEDSAAENTKRLYNDCVEAIEKIIAPSNR